MVAKREAKSDDDMLENWPIVFLPGAHEDGWKRYSPSQPGI